VVFAVLLSQLYFDETTPAHLPGLAKTTEEANSQDNFLCNQILDLKKIVGEAS
jgi:hypothetical protein